MEGIVLRESNKTFSSLQVAHVMCTALKRWQEVTGKRVGFKPAGGIRTAKQAVAYRNLVAKVSHAIRCYGREGLRVYLGHFHASNNPKNHSFFEHVVYNQKKRTSF